MKKIFLLSSIILLSFFSCKKEDDQVSPQGSAISASTSTSKTLRFVVTANSSDGSNQPLTISYKSSFQLNNWEWTDSCSSAVSFEKNVQVKKDDTMVIFVHSNVSTLFVFNISIYDGNTLVDQIAPCSLLPANIQWSSVVQ